ARPGPLQIPRSASTACLCACASRAAEQLLDLPDLCDHFIAHRALKVSQPIRNAPSFRIIFRIFDCLSHLEVPSTRKNSSSARSATCGYLVSIWGLCSSRGTDLSYFLVSDVIQEWSSRPRYSARRRSEKSPVSLACTTVSPARRPDSMARFDPSRCTGLDSMAASPQTR